MGTSTDTRIVYGFPVSYDLIETALGEDDAEEIDSIIEGRFGLLEVVTFGDLVYWDTYDLERFVVVKSKGVQTWGEAYTELDPSWLNEEPTQEETTQLLAARSLLLGGGSIKWYVGWDRG